MTTVSGVPGRDRTLDVLRAVATLRVVVFHATGDVRWSWFAAMPVMFFIGGALYAKSLDGRPGLAVFRSRMRRIMIPSWAWAALVFVTFTVAGAWGDVPWWGALGFVVPIVSPTGPPEIGGPLYWTWMHMWYIAAYVALMLLGIPARRAQRRWPVGTFVVLLAPVVVSGITRRHEIGGLTFIVVFWMAGYAYHDHRRRLPAPRVAGTVAVTAMAGAVAYAAAFTGFTTDLKALPFLFDLAGLAAVAAAVALRPLILRMSEVTAVDVVVTWFQRRALTVYLWHALAVGIVVNSLGRDTMPERPDVLTVGLVLPLTFVLVTLTGWIEDIAARRPPELVPGRSGADRSGVIDLRPWVPESPVDVRDRVRDPARPGPWARPLDDRSLPDPPPG